MPVLPALSHPRLPPLVTRSRSQIFPLYLGPLFILLLSTFLSRPLPPFNSFLSSVGFLYFPHTNIFLCRSRIYNPPLSDLPSPLQLLSQGSSLFYFIFSFLFLLPSFIIFTRLIYTPSHAPILFIVNFFFFYFYIFTARQLPVLGFLQGSALTPAFLTPSYLAEFYRCATSDTLCLGYQRAGSAPVGWFATLWSLRGRQTSHRSRAWTARTEQKEKAKKKQACQRPHAAVGIKYLRNGKEIVLTLGC